MKLISMTCPNCGASLQVDADKKKLTCNYCGNNLFIDDEVQHVQYDNAEDAGYQFERGRQRAQAELSRSNNVEPLNSTQTKKTNYTWLWVVGWILFFPIPLTVLIVRSKTLSTKAKIIILSVIWAVILLIGIIGNINDSKKETDRNTVNSNIESSVESNMSEGTEENLLPVIYADNENINIWLNRFNSLYPDEALTADDFSVYYHHGSNHKDQITFYLNDFYIVLTDGKAVITCYDFSRNIQKTEEECKEFFCKLAPIYCPNLSSSEIEERWNTDSRFIEYDDGLKLDVDVSTIFEKDYIETITIDGNLV